MKRGFLYFLLIISTVSAGAQDITIQAEGPSIVQVGQQFTVMWTVNTGGGQFSGPSFDGFYKLMGPQSSYSSNTQIINGKITTQTTNSFVYYLQALKEGKYVIPPAMYTFKNKVYTSDSIRIAVTGGGVTQQSNQSGTAPQDNTGLETASGDLFLNVSLSKKVVYIGEPFVATVKIYTRSELAGVDQNVKFPPIDGFFKVDLETPQLTSLKQENINGKIYGTGIVRQYLFYPQVTGEFTIDPVQGTVLLRQKSGASDPFFGDFFESYQTIPRAVLSKPFVISVKPLPGVKPLDFSGIVGKLDLSASLNKDSASVNDAVNLKVTVSGTGNLKLAEAPALKLSPDIDLYDPKITDNLNNSLNGTTGQRTFEYLLIPRHNGDYTIPPITYSYFNTSTSKYIQLKTSEFHLHVRKGNDQNAGVTVYGSLSKEDVQYVGKDIRFIKSNSGKLTKSANLILTKPAFYSSYAISFLLFIGLLFLRREHIKRNADIAAVRNRKARKIAVKRLHEASVCLKNGETDRFHEEILKALWGYLSDKLNIPVADLTRNNAVTTLEQAGIPEEEITKLSELLDACEFARYAPSASESKNEELYGAASQFIRSVENSIG